MRPIQSPRERYTCTDANTVSPNTETVVSIGSPMGTWRDTALANPSPAD
ncbi:MAG: hypothetical protein KME19_12645 [Microcoleus vaginatus WJT46-NPBG5]|nr:hypothetical protein [Microcoleus vaginatus WJT46-NPBG5]